MARFDSFEEMDCWNAARQLVKLVYLCSEHGKLSKDFETRSQIKRAALSSMNNIAEGYGRKSVKEFIRFLDISQSSSMEVKSITYALEDMNYLSSEYILAIREEAEKTKALTLGLIKYLSSRHPE